MELLKDIVWGKAIPKDTSAIATELTDVVFSTPNGEVALKFMTDEQALIALPAVMISADKYLREMLKEDLSPLTLATVNYVIARAALIVQMCTKMSETFDVIKVNLMQGMIGGKNVGEKYKSALNRVQALYPGTSEEDLADMVVKLVSRPWVDDMVIEAVHTYIAVRKMNAFVGNSFANMIDAGTSPSVPPGENGAFSILGYLKSHNIKKSSLH